MILPDKSEKSCIGQPIRDYSFDEFPQFGCVLIEMVSLCGTRFSLPEEVSLYKLHHRAGLAIESGITGMW